MLAKSFLEVSLQSRLSLESYVAKFGMNECARNNYGVTLSTLIDQFHVDLYISRGWAKLHCGANACTWPGNSGHLLHPEHDPLICQANEFLRKCFEPVCCWKRRDISLISSNNSIIYVECVAKLVITSQLDSLRWRNQVKRVIVYGLLLIGFVGKIESLYQESIAL